MLEKVPGIYRHIVATTLSTQTEYGRLQYVFVVYCVAETRKCQQITAGDNTLQHIFVTHSNIVYVQHNTIDGQVTVSSSSGLTVSEHAV